MTENIELGCFKESKNIEDSDIILYQSLDNSFKCAKRSELSKTFKIEDKNVDYWTRALINSEDSMNIRLFKEYENADGSSYLHPISGIEQYTSSLDKTSLFNIQFPKTVQLASGSFAIIYAKESNNLIVRKLATTSERNIIDINYLADYDIPIEIAIVKHLNLLAKCCVPKILSQDNVGGIFYKKYHSDGFAHFNGITQQMLRSLLSSYIALMQSGILHRDLKWSNTLFDLKKGELVIADYGASTSYILAGASNIYEYRHYNTYIYEPSERNNSVDNFSMDERHDAFGIGVMLFEVLIKQPSLLQEDDYSANHNKLYYFGRYQQPTAFPTDLNIPEKADIFMREKFKDTYIANFEQFPPHDLRKLIFQLVHPVPRERFSFRHLDMYKMHYDMDESIKSHLDVVKKMPYLRVDKIPAEEFALFIKELVVIQSMNSWHTLYLYAFIRKLEFVESWSIKDRVYFCSMLTTYILERFSFMEDEPPFSLNNDIIRMFVNNVDKVVNELPTCYFAYPMLELQYSKNETIEDPNVIKCLLREVVEDGYEKYVNILEISDSYGGSLTDLFVGKKVKFY